MYLLCWSGTESNLIEATYWPNITFLHDNVNGCGANVRLNDNQGKPVPMPLCPPQIPNELTFISFPFLIATALTRYYSV
jgi:hypothetical protein